MGRAADAVKWEAWRQRLRDFAGGTESVAEFCDRSGVSESSFYVWRCKLRSLPVGDNGATVAVAEPTTAARNSAALPISFLPIEITASSNVEVLLPRGARVIVPGHDHAALRTIIAALLSELPGDRPC